MEMSTTATASLDTAEITKLESIVAEAYGVESSELMSVIEYTMTGALIVDIAENISNVFEKENSSVRLEKANLASSTDMHNKEAKPTKKLSHIYYANVSSSNTGQMLPI